MRSIVGGMRCAVGALALVCGALPQWGWTEDKKPDAVARGQRLFEQVWWPEPTEEGGDGLGPLFNAQSCMACHFLGGIGGAGPNDHNIELMTAEVPQICGDLSAFQTRLNKLHRGFGTSTTIVLHSFSTEPGYTNFCDELLYLSHQDAAALKPKSGQQRILTVDNDDITLHVTERNTTPLFGVGLIDSIPLSAMQEVAQRQQSQEAEIRGRVAGRFGWRGQTTTLREFVRGACATEIGLQGSINPQAVNPVPKAGPALLRNDLDVRDKDCEDLALFVVSLTAPVHTVPTDKYNAGLIANGEGKFHSIGCAVCHMPNLATVEGIYSDLLLHDMGVSLRDPSPAPPDSRFSPRGSFSSYGGGGMPQSDEPPALVERRHREWKTPPLWGVRDSAPYLHDGRAPTIEQAIVLHGGEATASVNQFVKLSSAERAFVVAFLLTLTAPHPSNLPKLVEATSKSKKTELPTRISQAIKLVAQPGGK